MLPTLNSIFEQHAHTTKTNKADIPHLLDYAATNTNKVLKCIASDMVLRIESDVSCLSKPQSLSRTGGHYYVSSQPSNHTKAPHLPPPENGPIHIKHRIMRHIMVFTEISEDGGFSRMVPQL